MVSFGHRSKARANNPTILPKEYVEKTKSMLEEFGEIALSNFALFWSIKHGEIIDFVSLKYNGGLWWFLHNHDHLFEMRRLDDIWFVQNIRPTSRGSSSSDSSSKENAEPISRLARFKSKMRPEVGLRMFDDKSFLWNGQPWTKFLDPKYQFKIPMSAYEYAQSSNFSATSKAVGHIRAVLAKSPGMNLSELYRHINLTKTLELFKISSSISSLVDELPEVFYRDSNEAKIYDGHTHTIADLTGRDGSCFAGGPDPDVITTKAINEGLYQKTLLLIRQAGLKNGLKINVWREAMRSNFFPYEEEWDAVVATNAKSFFLALARFQLVELRSSDHCKNDILAFLPRKPVQYMQLKSELNDLVNMDNSSESDS